MLRPIQNNGSFVEAKLQSCLLRPRLKVNAKLTKRHTRVRAASEWPLELRRTRGAVHPVKSRTAAKRKRRSPAAATKLPAPEKTGRASAASRKDTPHRRRGARSLRSSQSAAFLRPDEVRVTVRGVPHESARLSRFGQRPVHRQKSAGWHSLPRRPAHFQYKNARGKTCAAGLRCGMRPPP